MTHINFGDRRSFAICVQLEHNYHGKWLFGHLCYWVLGRAVGNFETTTSLRDALGQMQQVIRDSGQRQNAALFEAPPEEVFYALDSSLYGESRKAERKGTIILPENFGVYEGRIPIESFDGWKVFIIDCGDDTRVLYKHEGDDEIHIGVIEFGKFDDALLHLHEFIDDLLEKEESSAQ